MANRLGRVVIIGGGHNGLVAAFYLAKAGYAPLVLERRAVVGGMAVTEEIHPGFRCPALAHTPSPLLPHIMQELQLQKHGLQIVRQEVAAALRPDGRAIRIYAGDPQRTATEISALSRSDAGNYPAFEASLQRIGSALRPWLSRTPPDVDHLNLDDYLSLGKFGLKFRSLDRKDAYRLLRWGPMAIADLVAEWFETELLRAFFAARGIYGALAGPWSAGTSVGLLLQAAYGVEGGIVRGGPGAVTQALAKAATAAGAQIQTDSNVVRIGVRNGEATSVVLESGQEVPAVAVVSNADPRRTFMSLVDAGDLEPGFLSKVRSYRIAGGAAKVNLALSGLPAFSGLSNGNAALPARLHIGPDIDYLERAFDAAKYGGYSERPYLDVTVPSLADASLAPSGAHVMSVHVQYAPYRLKTGDWKSLSGKLGESVLQTLEIYAPKIRESIVGSQIITPADMEQTYGLSGGHIFHGEHALDQLFAFRPFLGFAQYRTPIKSLYLCGAGTHPGGGITGAPGANASREVIKDLRSR